MSRIFTARYNGRCPACGEVITAGENLTWRDDEAVHHGCADREEPPPRPTCPKCWQVVAVNGECGCDA